MEHDLIEATGGQITVTNLQLKKLPYTPKTEKESSPPLLITMRSSIGA